MITENLSAADQAMLQQVEDTMYAIENEMTAAGFTGRIKEAQVLYILKRAIWRCAFFCCKFDDRP